MVHGICVRSIFGFGYFPGPNYVSVSFGTYPLRALLLFLKEHGYSYQFDEEKSWNEGFLALKDFLRKGTPVLIISYIGWLRYTKEYEVFRQIGGVVNHYIVVTGFRDNEVVYINDPHPDLYKKEKLREIQSTQCPMLVVTSRRRKPDPKEILKRSLHRAVKQMDTTKGPVGMAGLKKASN